MSLHGWLVIDKPAGMSSAQVVGKVKRILRSARLGSRASPELRSIAEQGGGAGSNLKIGHAGTLDPFATGVLPLALGEATKTAGYGLDKDKSYDFELTFGEATDTEDCTGKFIATSDKRPTLAEIEAILLQFRGELSQVPPIYSAIHIDGKRAYALARAGETPEMEARKIVVKSLELRVKSDFPINSPLLTLNFSVTCSKGTYIRSLARDIALKLGTVGHVSALRRTKSGVFTLAQAISLENLEESAKEGALLGLLQPIHAVLDDIPVLRVNEEEAANLRHGKTLLLRQTILDSFAQARCGDELIAIGQVSEKIFKSQRVFNVTSKGDH